MSLKRPLSIHITRFEDSLLFSGSISPIYQWDGLDWDDDDEDSPPAAKKSKQAETSVDYVSANDRFLYTLLSQPIPRALSPDYSEAELTEHMRRCDLVPADYDPFKSQRRQLPLEYADFDQYFRAYLPLMMYDQWAGVRADYLSQVDDNGFKSCILDVLNYGFLLRNGLITIHLGHRVWKSDLDQYRLKNWLVLLHVPTSDPTPDAVLLGLVNTTQIKNINSEPMLVDIAYSILVTQPLSTLRKTSIDCLCVRLIHRYHQGLRHLKSLFSAETKQDMDDILLRPDPALYQLNTNQSQHFKWYDEDRYNPYQKEAIVASFNAVYERPDVTRTVLIQGPPGTGKSHTLVGIVKNLFANRRVEKWTDPPRPWPILICAPTNCAIDEIARRLLIQESTFMYNFKIRLLRLGPAEKVHPDVLPLHIDELQHLKRTSSGSALIEKADLILSTLDSVHHYALLDTFDNSYRLTGWPKIRAVIVDEASQCAEPTLLMPLIYPCRKLILIGDHLQLPAITQSRAAKAALYDRSFLERLVHYFKARGRGKIPLHTLAIQYRMRSEIASFPSERFYARRLETPPGTGHNPALSALQPMIVFDLADSRVAPSRRYPSSKANPTEADFIHKLVCSILEKANYKPDDPNPPPFTIGIITFYKGQKFELAQRFADTRLAQLVDINSVDGFQGQERDVVIISCVRAFNWTSLERGVGFVRSAQRMNVALTRAKSALYVCLNEPAFRGVPNWRQLIEKARARDRFRSTTSTVSPQQLDRMISI